MQTAHMSLRKEVFQAKVLQRLYPASPEAEKVLDSPSPKAKSATPPGRVQLQLSTGSGGAGGCRLASRKVYTVLPPPDDYRPSSADGPATADRAGNASSTHDPADSDDRDGTEDEDLVRRRRRRRKRKAGVVSEPGEAGAVGTLPQEGAAARQTEGAGEKGMLESQGPKSPEQLSRNKKRKMKKKRHRERLLSLGLVPRPRALEFTYTHSDSRDEEEGGDGSEETPQTLDGILDFLQRTWYLYTSDRSSAAGRPFLSASVAESLFTRMSDRTSPPAGLTSLRQLGALLGQRDVGKLSRALQEFSSTSTLPADETALICALFHYWITDVLPVQKERNA